MLVLLVFCLSVSPAFTDAPALVPTGDEISQGLWWLYQLQYEKSHDVFEHFSEEHPDDPAGPFYESAVDWWQLAQQLDYPLPQIRKRFEDDYQQTMARGNRLLKTATTDDERSNAWLYLGGAEGLKGRWQVTQRQWISAYVLGRRGHKWLIKSLRYNKAQYDAYMGLGIYDYFTDTLSGVVGALSGLLIHGDRKRGIQELQEAIAHGRRARVESMFFLIEIYTFEEKKPQEGLVLAERLRDEFPDSPAVQLAVITDLYSLARWDDVKKEAQDFLEKSRRQRPYFTAEGIRPGLYCLGVAALYGDHRPDLCFNDMAEILAQGEDSSRWVTFAYLRRGQVEDLRGQRDQAVADYKRVMDRPDFWGSHEEAQQYLKKSYT